MASLKRNLDIAIQLLNTPENYTDYISIKISPSNGGCCCFDHWPGTWGEINEFIFPAGPIKNEGAVLIEQNNEKFVLECHESGPEIIIYLGLGTASIVLVKSVVELMITILKSRQKREFHGTAKFKITSRRLIDSETEDEIVTEINLPLSEDAVEALNRNISKVFQKRKK
jgi:hypothetical protein